MLATFCVRLALGLILWLPLIWNCSPHPRFVRTQFLTALGLLAIATVTAWDDPESWRRELLLGSTSMALIGALAWTFQPAPGGRMLILALDAVLLFVLIFNEVPAVAADGVVSSMLLGATMTAMLAGHSYLISPGLALTPLVRMHRALFVAIGLRSALSATALAWWTLSPAESTLNTVVALWLPVRWIVGIVGPVGFGMMAYSAARIRSTQSATGILYVAVVCTILGELMGLLVLRQTGLPL